MRLAAAIGVIAGCAWAVSSASADTGATILRPSICGSSTQFTILFWPHGHHPIGRDNLPAVIPQPHFEVYSSGNKTKFAPTDYVGGGFASQSGSAGGFGHPCKALEPKLSSVSHGKTSTADSSTALVCTFRSPPVHEAVGLVNYDTT